MPDKIDVRKIDRVKLGKKLEWGDREKIKDRLDKKEISVSKQTISNSFNPKYPIGHKIIHVLKETVRYLADKEKTYEVVATKELADELQTDEV